MHVLRAHFCTLLYLQFSRQPQHTCIVDFNSLQESSNFPPVTPYYAYFILQSWNTPRMTTDLE